jgi:hypothetical protein
MYCVIAMAIASAGLIYVPRRIRIWNTTAKQPLNIKPGTADILPLALCIAAVIGAWHWGNHMAMPAYDEVFSAHNAAGIHPFQTVSYYMLPNNHLFFNLINNVFFHPFADKVATGRIISLIACCSLIVILFYSLKKVIQNRWLAALACITLALQFPVWGFSFQARGYELYLLAEWGMVISLFCYIQSGHKNWLGANLLSIAIGYFCIPSFLYMHVAQLLFTLLHWIFYKQKDSRFWKYQLAAIFLAFLFYLPALCFSGLDSIARNTWVSPMGGNKTAGDFVQWMWPNFGTYVTHLFSDIHWNSLSFNWLLFTLPLALVFFRKNKSSVLFGMFYLVMWLVFFLIIIIMKKMPFERNLIGHYSLTLAGIIWLCWSVAGLLFRRENLLIAKQILFCCIIIPVAVHFVATNESMLKDGLYEYEVNMFFVDLSNKLKEIPRGTSVAFSDESFYCYFICRKQRYKVTRCTTGNEDYYIKQAFEPLPQLLGNRYALAFTIVQYEIYKRN